MIFYYPSLAKILPIVTQELRIEGFGISKGYFQRILTDGRQWKIIKLLECNIDSRNIKLNKHLEYSLKELYLDGSGSPEFSNWEEYPGKLLNIFIAISSSPLLKSLSKLSLMWWYVEGVLIRNMMEKMWFSGIEIVNYYMPGRILYNFK